MSEDFCWKPRRSDKRNVAQDTTAMMRTSQEAVPWSLILPQLEKRAKRDAAEALLLVWQETAFHGTPEGSPLIHFWTSWDAECMMEAGRTGTLAPPAEDSPIWREGCQ